MGTLTLACDPAASSRDYVLEDAEQPDILDELKGLAGIRDVEEIDCEQQGYRAFRFVTRQPVVHGDPDGETFDQQLILLYKDRLAPTVLSTFGYAMRSRTRLELVPAALSANELRVEHRYFGTSAPKSGDLGGLKVKQAAGDLHEVVRRLKPLLPGSWISAGTSKGGMNALIHRRFYPFDTDATITFGAPVSFGTNDRRYRGYMSTIGTDSCRTKILDFQRWLLENKTKIVEKIPDHPSFEGLTFDILPGGLREGVEHGVHGVELFCWQYFARYLLADDCASVPTEDSSLEDAMSFTCFSSAMALISDQMTRSFWPYYVQSQTELGGPSWLHEDLEDLFTVDVEDTTPFLMGAEIDAFDPLPMVDLYFWTSLAMNRSLMIYGKHDPWTAAAIGLFDPRIGEAYVFTAPAVDHTMSVDDLREQDRKTAVDAIKRWTGATWVNPVKPSMRAPTSLYSKAPVNLEDLRPFR